MYNYRTLYNDRSYYMAWFGNFLFDIMNKCILKKTTYKYTVSICHEATYRIHS